MTDQQNLSGMGDLLKKVMENPELLSGAMSMASALASSGALGNLSSLLGSSVNSGNTGGSGGTSELLSSMRENGRERAESSSPRSTEAMREEVHIPPQETDRPRGETPRRSGHIGQKERIALLEAMRPFISPDKKDRLELLIRLLGVMELAEGMGR